MPSKAQNTTRHRLALGIENSIQFKGAVAAAGRRAQDKSSQAGRTQAELDEDQVRSERTHATNFIFICIFRLTTSQPGNTRRAENTAQDDDAGIEWWPGRARRCGQGYSGWEGKRQSLHTSARLIYNTKVYLTPLWKLKAETPR